MIWGVVRAWSGCDMGCGQGVVRVREWPGVAVGEWLVLGCGLRPVTITCGCGQGGVSSGVKGFIGVARCGRG